LSGGGRPRRPAGVPVVRIAGSSQRCTRSSRAPGRPRPRSRPEPGRTRHRRRKIFGGSHAELNAGTNVVFILIEESDLENQHIFFCSHDDGNTRRSSWEPGFGGGDFRRRAETTGSVLDEAAPVVD
jgi:hypothetical protein